MTGTTDAVEAKKLTFSVGRVTEEQLKQVPASSPIAALAGKISGVRVAVGTGNPGSAPAIRLRGSTNLTVGRNEPLIIIDGVISRNSLADIDANDVESIDVLKGAAAASFYGSNAANGVINIVTKRGKNLQDNSVSFSTRSEYGTSDVYRFVPLNEHHNYQLNADGSIKLKATGTARLLDPDNIADNPYPATGPEPVPQPAQGLAAGRQLLPAELPSSACGAGATNLHSSFTTDATRASCRSRRDSAARISA